MIMELMSSDYDKQQWQSEQAARDLALEKQREKEAKARIRSARNARRKLERLHRTLSEQGEISDFENEFGESVLERLDQFGSAFQDREKGRPGDALSFAQKRVVAAMNKKVKDLKKRPVPSDDLNGDYERRFKNKGFKSKRNFTPRIRHIEDDIINQNGPPHEEQPVINICAPRPKRPYLRLVKTDNQTS